MARHTRNNQARNALAYSTAMIALMAAAPVLAQTAPAPDKPANNAAPKADEIVVTGFRAGLQPVRKRPSGPGAKTRGRLQGVGEGARRRSGLFTGGGHGTLSSFETTRPRNGRNGLSPASPLPPLWRLFLHPQGEGLAPRAISGCFRTALAPGPARSE